MTLPSIKRPFNAAEQRYLKGRLDSLRQWRHSIWKRAILSSFAICGVLAGLTLLAARDVNPKLIIGLWTCIAAAISIWISLEERHRIWKRQKDYNETISQGMVYEFRVVSSRMVEFEEIEDEGACYAFELDAGGVVFITGQEFYESARFPNDDFSIVEFRNTGNKVVAFQIEKRGKKLSPFQRVSADEKKRLILPDHLTTVSGTIDAFMAKQLFFCKFIFHLGWLGGFSFSC